jgi:hypothetical protein
MIHKLEVGQLVSVRLRKTRNTRALMRKQGIFLTTFDGVVMQPDYGKGRAAVMSRVTGSQYSVPVECITPC